MRSRPQRNPFSWACPQNLPSDLWQALRAEQSLLHSVWLPFACRQATMTRTTQRTRLRQALTMPVEHHRASLKSYEAYTRSMGSLDSGQVSLESPALLRAHILTQSAGFQPTLPLCLTPALTLLLYQLLSRLRVPWKVPRSSRQSSASAFLSGASANALALTILYPLLLAKVRVQAARSKAAKNSSGGSAPASSMTEVWVAAVSADGWAGLYQALGAQILKGFVNQGVTMLVKQR